MAGKRRPPNVVVCLCDQLRAFEVGCYGNPAAGGVRTPNIDRLAANGVRFEIACSNNPVCSPARSILLSGQYSRTCMGSLINVCEPVRERVHFPNPVLPEGFKAAGYHTGLVGKWHIGPHPATLGFDSAVYPRYSHRYTGQTFFDIDGRETLVPDFTVGHELDALGRYVREHRDEPFFLFHNISQPHMPLIDAPDRYTKMYSRDDVPLRPNVRRDGKLAHDENWFRIYLWDYLYYREHLPYTEEPLGDFDLRDLAALYCGLTTWADDQLGELMRLLNENGVAENTIVLFTSDHGDNLGSHHLFNKGQLYEESIRIPMVFRWPDGLAPRCVATQVASLADVMPTLLSLAGVEASGAGQGTDLSPVLRGDVESAGENLAFIETTRGDIGIRTLTHLYGIRKTKEGRDRAGPIQDDRYMFFDVLGDALQEENLAKTDRDEQTASALRERLTQWDRETPWMGAPDD